MARHTREEHKLEEQGESTQAVTHRHCAAVTRNRREEHVLEDQTEREQAGYNPPPLRGGDKRQGGGAQAREPDQKG